jgi:hypothetical protein
MNNCKNTWKPFEEAFLFEKTVNEEAGPFACFCLDAPCSARLPGGETDPAKFIRSVPLS